MKRMTSLLLSLFLILTLAACAALVAEPVATPVPQSASTPAPEQSATPPADEYERAVWYGFVPKELASVDPKSPVTWAQYCRMLGSMISTYDESQLLEFISGDGAWYDQLRSK